MKKSYLLFALLCGLFFPVTAQTIVGIDVSAIQGVISWPSVSTSGKTFAFVKATKGVCYTDTKFSTNMTNGGAAGIKLGAYHFALPEDNTAVAEANYFLSVAGSYIGVGYLPPVLDLEDPAGTCIVHTAPLTSYFTSSTLSSWVQTWVNTVHTSTGVMPIIYTSASIASYLSASVTNCKLWIANPGTSPTTPPSSTGVWTTWSFKQYDWFGTVAGISGNVDLDVFNGTIGDFNILIGTGGQPDLKVVSPSLSSSSVAAGGAITAYCAEDNSGTSSSSANQVSYYLSADTILTPGASGDVYLNSQSFPSLVAGSNSIVYSQTLTIPITTTPGNYYIFYWADGGQVVTESSETNNFVRLPVTVTASTTTRTISTSITGSGTTTGAGTYPYGATANLLATPNPGSTFINWTEGATVVSINQSYSFNVTTNRNLTANFSGCAYTLNSSGVTVYSPATSQSFWVYTTPSCSWTATTSGCSWVTLVTASGTGDGMVTFNIAANTSTSPRSCTISAGGQNFLLTQNGYVPPCSTTPSTPTGISASVTASNSLYVSWTGTYSGGTYWELERSNSVSGPFSLIAYVPVSSGGSYLDSNLIGGTTYYYRVRLCCDGNCSGYTSVCSATACTWHAMATNIVSSADTICPGETIHFTVQGGMLGTGDVWTWKNAACYTTSVIATGTSISYAPLTSGFVVVRPEGSTCPQPVVNCVIKYFTVRPVPTASTISATGPTTFCSGGSVTLTGNSGGVWSTGSTNVALSVISSGDYFVTTPSICGNVSSNHILVTVDSPIITTYVYPSTNICFGDSAILSGGGATTYLWTGGVTNGVPIFPSATQTYTVTGTDGMGCSAKKAVTITVDPAPNAGNIVGASSVCVGATIFLSNSSLGGLWSASNTSAFVSSTGVVLGMNAGPVIISYSVANTCGTANAQKSILVTDCATELENVGTAEELSIFPNPTFDNITISSTAPIYTVLVYNAIGQNVFSSSYKEKKVQIDLKHLPPGNYLIRINSVIIRRLVKE